MEVSEFSEFSVAVFYSCPGHLFSDAAVWEEVSFLPFYQAVEKEICLVD